MHLIRATAVRTAVAISLLSTGILGALPRPGDGGSPHPRPQPAAKAKPQKSPDTCALLSADDIKKVNAVAVEEMKPSRQNASTIVMWQCYYRAKVLSDSVHLMHAKPGRDPESARAFWKETITKAAESPLPKAAPTSKAELKQVRHHPQKVEGVGEEAWWIGDRKAGALYVLQGKEFIRISIGGAGEEGQKRDRSKQLAQLVLKRMAKS